MNKKYIVFVLVNVIIMIFSLNLNVNAERLNYDSSTKTIYVESSTTSTQLFNWLTDTSGNFENIVFNSDVNLTCYGENNVYNFLPYENKTRTIDLNGHNVTIGNDSCSLMFGAKGKSGSFSFIDSSEEKTGVFNNKFVAIATGSTININGGTYTGNNFMLLRYYDANDNIYSASSIDLTIDNIKYTGNYFLDNRSQLLGSNHISLSNVALEPTEAVMVFSAHANASNILLTSIIKNGYTAYGPDGEYSSATKVDDIELRGKQLYIAKDIDLFDMSDFFETSYVMNSSSPPILALALANQTNDSVLIKKVKIDNTEDFTLTGSGNITLNANSSLTTNYIIGPKKNLSKGIYKTNIILTDNEWNYYVHNISYEVKKWEVAKPTIDNSRFFYDGNEKELTFVGTQTGIMEISGNKGTKVGSYEATVSLKNKDSYCWDDGTTDDLKFKWTIEKNNIAKPNIWNNNFTYNGQKHELVLLDFNSEVMNITNNVATEVGHYQAVVSLKDNWIWQDGTEDPLIFDWDIEKAKISKPTIDNGSFFYDGNEKQLTLSGFNSGLMEISGNKGTKVGSYEATVSLKNKDSYSWDDGTTDDLKLKWVIKKNNVSKPSVEYNKFSYDGEEHVLTVLGFNPESQELSGNVATEAGHYQAVVSLKENWTWQDGTEDPLIFDWEIEPVKIEKPTMGNNRFEYNGVEHEVEVLGFNSFGMNITDNVATDEGHYQAVITPRSNYAWSDGTKDPVVFDWEIYRLVNGIIINGSQEALNYNNKVQYSAEVLPENASNKEIVWSVENITGEATIDQNGLLTVIKDGTIKIIVQAKDGSNVKEELVVNVEKFINVDEIVITAPDKYLNNSQSIYLQANVYPSNVTNSELVWTSSDTSIASINETTGAMTTKNKQGAVTITATAKDKSGVKGTITFLVGYPHISIGEETSVGNDLAVSYDTVEWEISNSDILENIEKNETISNENNYYHSIQVKGLKEGTSNVIMKTISGDVLYQTEVHVYTPLQQITANYEKINLEPNEEKTIEISYTPENVNELYKKVLFTSEDDNIVTVDQNGNLVAHNTGKTNIIVSSQYYGLNITIPVNVSIYAKSIETNTDNITLNDDNKTFQLEYQVKPDNATNKKVSFESSDKSVVTVSNTGLVTAINNGEATITIKTEDGKQTKTIPVTVSGLSENNIQVIFKDVNNGDWYYEVVKKAYQKGIILGYNESTFAPGDKVTRGQLVTILWRMEKEPDASTLDNPFKDVGDDYYTSAVKWASSNDIIHGYNATKFGPNDPIIRQDLVVILNNYAKYKGLDVSSSYDLSTFTDYNKVKGGYAEPALKWAVENHVMSGQNINGKKYISPANNTTRAETAAMIINYIEKFN